jgi:positive regulator of sigma E activity
MFDPNHLTKAREYSLLSNSKLFYFKHMWWALTLAFLLLYWSVLMVVHAIIPQLVGFTVIKNLVDLIKKLKQEHPEDPILSKINFEE